MPTDGRFKTIQTNLTINLQEGMFIFKCQRKISIVGVTGTSCAGKGLFTQYLEQIQGVHHLSMSDEIAEALKEQGLQYTRENLINVGNELREENGSDFFAKRLLERAQEIGGVKIIESLRNHAEVEAVQAAGGVVVGIDAAIRTRYERSQRRKNGKDRGGFEAFEEKDRFERNSGIPGGQNIGECMKMADYTLENDGTPEQLYDKIDRLWATIFQE